MALGFAKAAPTHCSGPEAEEIFKKIYGENFIPVEIGQEIDI
jgi:metal-dependent hydrolase (beta-lactamase superfamily II)